MEPFGSLKAAFKAGLQEKWKLHWKKSWSSIQTSEKEGFHVQVLKYMRRGTLTTKLFKFFCNQFLLICPILS